MPMRSAVSLIRAARLGAGDIVHGREESQIFAAAQASVKTFVAAGVVAKLAARAGGIPLDVAIRQSHARPRVGIINVASTRSSVDLPAPFGPTIATASAGLDRKGNSGERSFGRASDRLAASARHPERAGGKYFSSDSTEMAGADITVVITEFALANPVPSLLFGPSASRMGADELISAGRAYRSRTTAVDPDWRKPAQPDTTGAAEMDAPLSLHTVVVACTRTGFVSSR